MSSRTFALPLGALSLVVALGALSAACSGAGDTSVVSADQSLGATATTPTPIPSCSGPVGPLPSGSAPSTSPSGAGSAPAPDRPWDGAAWDGGPWSPGAAPASLEAALDQMVGTWIGVARTPWRPPYLVKLSFQKTSPVSGRYTSRCIDSHGDCVAMYYGTDADLADKTFALENVKTNGAIDGVLALVFGPGHTSAYRETLRELRLDASNDGLRFDVFNGDYGPVSFDLRRVPASP